MRIEIRGFKKKRWEPRDLVLEERRGVMTMWDCVSLEDGELFYREVPTGEVIWTLLEALGGKEMRKKFSDIQVLEEGERISYSEGRKVPWPRRVGRRYEIRCYAEGKEVLRKVYREKKRPQKWHCIINYPSFPDEPQAIFSFCAEPPRNAVAYVLKALRHKPGELSETDVYIDGQLVYFDENGTLVKEGGKKW